MQNCSYLQSMIKLIVTDLDGTLLTDRLELPGGFLPLTRRLFAVGIKIAIATGRPNSSIAEKFAPILSQLYAISDNGGLIRNGKQELLSKPLPQAEIQSLVSVARGIKNAWPVLCGKDTWYLENTDEAFINKVHLYTKNYRVVEDLTKIDTPIIKLSLCDLAGAEQNSYKYYRQFENSLKVAVGGASWLDVTMPKANKGEAVQFLQRLHDITPDETLVFGDLMNDYEMMKTATYSYAMKNAYPKLKEAAKFITEKDNNEGGVLDVIEKLCFINELGKY